MRKEVHQNTANLFIKWFSLNNQRAKLLFVIAALLITLSFIFQDFLFSEINSTNFNLSEVLLFKIFWLCFVPLTYLAFFLQKKLNGISRKLFTRLILLLASVLVLSFLHMLISSFIISIAGNVWYNFQFTTWQLATSKLVDYLGITILFYFLAISVAEYTHQSTIKINTLEKNNRTEKPKVITVRDGKKVVIVKTSSILWIKSDKPYIAIYTEEGKYLHNSSLRDVLKELNDANFVRIHRSTIVNVSKIDKLISRLNGDYDVVMESSQKLRLSRTYKNNLNDQLLSSST